MRYRQPVTAIFYTETKEGIKTLVGQKTCKNPNRTKAMKELQTQGFVNGIHTYGWSEKSRFMNENDIELVNQIHNLKEL